MAWRYSVYLLSKEDNEIIKRQTVESEKKATWIADQFMRNIEPAKFHTQIWRYGEGDFHPPLLIEPKDVSDG